MQPKLNLLLIQEGSTMKQAISAIDRNALGICFVVDKKNKILGVLTDGDIRRALIRNAKLTTLVSDVMTKNYVSLPISSSEERIQKKLTGNIKVIPLVDPLKRILDYASNTRIRRIPVAQPVLDGNELAYVTDCVKTNWISSQGKYVDRFEEMFSKYIGSTNAIAVSNGTVAIHLALVTLDVGPGDEVIVPNLTFAATANAVLHCGATPVLVDIDPRTLTIDPNEVRKAIGAKTKAIIPVHLFGQPCDMENILALAKKHKLKVIEDCAESLGSTYRGKHLGTFGDAATFSFFGNKTLTTGEGGMIVFKKQSDSYKANLLRDHGMSREKRYWHNFVGFNYRMTNLQAAIGVAQLERIDALVQSKIRLGKRYISNLRTISSIELPAERSDCVNSFWLFTLLLGKNISYKQRNALVKMLLSLGIESRPIFFPLHLMPPYKKYAKKRSFSNSIDVSNRGLSLPSSSSLTREECDEICSSLISILKTKKD